MKTVQANLRLPEDVKNWIYTEAAKEDRSPGYYLAKLIRPMITKIDGDAHLQESLPISSPAQDKGYGFDEWWALYPKKADKKAAKRKWITNNLYRIASKLIQDVRNRLESDSQWKNGFIPNPTTYINGERWNDELQIDPKSQREKEADDWANGIDSGVTYEHE
jgi:hypothetical protein